MIEPATILIIEDNPLEAQFFKQILQGAGFFVVGPASCGEEALKIAKMVSPDLILADISIEGQMDGIEVSQLIADQSGAGILYLSGHSELVVVERAKNTEPYGYLVKPVEHQELTAAVTMALCRRSVARKLADSEEHFRLLYEDAPLAYLSLDGNLKIINFNKALADLMRRCREDILNTGLDELLTNEAVSQLEKGLKKEPEGPFSISFEMEVAGAQEPKLALEMHASRAISVRDGTTIIHCILNDVTESRMAAEVLKRSERFLTAANEELESRVTERTGDLLEANRKLAEEVEIRSRTEVSLRQSEERFRVIVDSSRDSMFVKDRSRRYTMVNSAMAEMLGREIDDIIGKRAEDIYPPDAANHIREVDLRVLDGDRIEEEHTRSIGSVNATFLDTRFPLVRGNMIEGICGVSRNITDRRMRAVVNLPRENDVMSRGMRACLEEALMVAKTDATVFITGESGAGKDWLAKFIHSHSKRGSGAFFSLNCAALPADLAEIRAVRARGGCIYRDKGTKERPSGVDGGWNHPTQ